VKFFIALLLILASLLGLSYYKNSLIQKSLADEFKHYPQLRYSSIECSGFVKSDCKISNPEFRSLPLAKSITIKGIDPTDAPSQKKSKELNIHIFADGAKYSLWDLLVKKNAFMNMGGFYKKHSGDYNISANLLLGLKGENINSVKILSLRADDRFLPYKINGDLRGIGESLRLKSLYFSFDLSKKRELFDEYIDSLRECCIENIPKEYQSMSNDEIYEQIKSKLKSFHTRPAPLDKIISALSNDDKKILGLHIKAKGDVPIQSMILPFLMLGPKAIERFYDIKVVAE
jgi:hypothetical protein